MSDPTVAPTPHFGLLIEGHCPWGHGELERRDGCGWCHECDAGFSIRRDMVTLHAEVRLHDA